MIEQVVDELAQMEFTVVCRRNAMSTIRHIRSRKPALCGTAERRRGLHQDLGQVNCRPGGYSTTTTPTFKPSWYLVCSTLSGSSHILGQLSGRASPTARCINPSPLFPSPPYRHRHRNGRPPSSLEASIAEPVLPPHCSILEDLQDAATPQREPDGRPPPARHDLAAPSQRRRRR